MPALTITTAGTAVVENFDTLASTGTSSVLPNGWAISETGTASNTLYSAGTGSSTSGDTYSFGAAGSTERALGSVQSGSLIPVFGANYINGTGGAITSLSIAYTGEEWRLGTATRADRLDFQYSLDATSLTTGAWTDVDALDFSTPDMATIGAKDGNLAAERTNLASVVTGLNIGAGAGFWIRFSDVNASGADDGLAVDNFSITASGSGGSTTTVSIGNVSVTEGNSGTTLATFTVARSDNTGAFTLNYATADGTAPSRAMTTSPRRVP